MGFGKIQLFVAELLRTRKPGEYVVVICGNNRRLQKILLAEFGKQEGVQILGYTEKIADLWLLPMCVFTKTRRSDYHRSSCQRDSDRTHTPNSRL